MLVCTVGTDGAPVCALTYRRLAPRVPRMAVLMEPALQQEIESGPADEEVGVIIRLIPGADPPPNVRIVARFDDICTARILRGYIVIVRQDPRVVSVKASTKVIPPTPLESASEGLGVVEDIEAIDEFED